MAGLVESDIDQRRAGPIVQRSIRSARVGGITRRQLLRASIGAGIGFWIAELAGGTI
jgi:hypothetical protein